MIHCKIVTPKGVYKECDTSILNVVTTDGQRGILTNHVPVVSMLKISKMATIEDNNREEYAIGGGLLYFNDNTAMILVDSIENAKEIDIDRAKSAKQRAEERIASKSPEIDMIRAEAALLRAINRIKVFGE